MKLDARCLLFTALLALGLFAPEASAQTCTPRGYVCFFSGCYYDHIANGTPTSDTCWSHTANYITGNTTCGYSSNGFEFTYTGRTVSQSFVVPSNFTNTNWNLGWLMDLDDPNNDGGWNKFKADVWDDTTHTLLASYYTDGSQPDQYCARRDLLFTGNFAGHTLTVIFTGQSAYPNTHIRVRGVFLYQY